MEGPRLSQVQKAAPGPLKEIGMAHQQHAKVAFPKTAKVLPQRVNGRATPHAPRWNHQMEAKQPQPLKVEAALQSAKATQAISMPATTETYIRRLIRVGQHTVQRVGSRWVRPKLGPSHDQRIIQKPPIPREIRPAQWQIEPRRTGHRSIGILVPGKEAAIGFHSGAASEDCVEAVALDAAVDWCLVELRVNLIRFD